MRPIDHCVLPTADLGLARARLTSLGFTVSPDGRHPFGTANCCVYFADGTFLEPLAVADAAVAVAASGDGNVFTARDAEFRRRNGTEGFSALAFGTADAGRDHDEFMRAGLSAGRPLEFSRSFVDASGRSDTASFRLAFAADSRAPDVFFFTGERVRAPAVDRSALQEHANGVERIKTVVLEAPQPSDFVDFVASVAGSRAVETSAGFRFAAANGDILLRRTQHPGTALRLVEIVFGVSSFADTAASLKESGATPLTDSRLTVAPAPGQGAAFTFEALPNP